MGSEASSCPECGAEWGDGLTCQAAADQMEVWDFEHWDVAGEVHDLSGLCYHIQHPGLYSSEGLAEAISLIEAYVERGVSPAMVLRRNQARYRTRTWRWTPRGVPASYGKPIQWTMTAPDVVKGGFDGCPDRVRAWARSVYRALHASPGDES
jgi:hypothetical protein